MVKIWDTVKTNIEKSQLVEFLVILCLTFDTPLNVYFHHNCLQGTCHLIKNLVHGDHMSIRYSCVAWPTMSTQAAGHLVSVKWLRVSKMRGLELYMLIFTRHHGWHARANSYNPPSCECWHKRQTVNPAPLYLAAATYDGAVFVWSTGSDQLVALLSRTVSILVLEVLQVWHLKNLVGRRNHLPSLISKHTRVYQ